MKRWPVMVWANRSNAAFDTGRRTVIALGWAVLLVGVGACSDDSLDPSKTRHPPGSGSLTEAGVASPDPAATESEAGIGDGTSGPTETSSERTEGTQEKPTAPTTGAVTSTTTSPSTTSPDTSPPTTSSSTASDAPTIDPPTTNPPTPGTPVLEPPEGLSDCQEELNTPDDGSCTYQLKCAERQLWANCVPGTADEWQCFCLTQGTSASQEYSLTGVDQQSACQAGITFCNTGHTPELDEPTCSIRSNVDSTNSCSHTKECVATSNLGNGAAARLTLDGGTSRCSGYDGQMDCVCDGNKARYMMFGTDGSRACSLLDGLCSGETELGEQEGCARTYSSWEPTSCSLEQLCGTRTDLDVDAQVFVLSDVGSMSSYCSRFDDETTCSCFNGIAQVAANPQVDDIMDGCYAIETLCSDDEALSVVGDLTCDGEYTLQVNGSRCSSSARCGYEVAIGQTPASLDGILSVDCEPTSDAGSWSCSCRSQYNVGEPFSVSGADVFEICSDALPSCAPQVTGFQFDTYGSLTFTFGEVPEPAAP